MQQSIRILGSNQQSESNIISMWNKAFNNLKETVKVI